MEDIVTRRNRRAIATVCGLAAVLAMAACTTQAGGAGAQAGAPVPAADGAQAPNGLDPNAGLNAGGSTSGETTADSAPTGTVATLIAKATPKMGNIVTDATGRTLYRFDKDGSKPAKSNCDGQCAVTWPPLLSEAIPTLQGVDPQFVGTVIRSDGKQQVTLGGWPLYTYAKDPGPGKWAGQGVGGTWFVSDPTGKRNLSCLPPGVKAPTGKAEGEDAAPSNSGGAVQPPAAGSDTGGYNY
jgi:predicted lipoprotein with Yx(FWY)xxD motif